MLQFLKKKKFKKIFSKHAADGTLDSIELFELKKLKQQLGLDKSFFHELKSRELKKHIEERLSSVLISGRFSLDDEEYLRDISRKLDVEINFLERLYAQRALWEHDNKKEFEFYNVEADIELEPDEVCHGYCQAVIMKPHTPRRHDTQSITINDRTYLPVLGNIYLLNTRIFFIGIGEIREIPYSDIAKFRKSNNSKTSKNCTIFITDSVGEEIIIEMNKHQAEYALLLLSKLS